MRYDMRLIHKLCGELDLRSRMVRDDCLEIDLGSNAVLCFVNSENEKDCLVGFKGTPWHAHGDFVFTDHRGQFTQLNYLDVLTGLREGRVLVCELWRSASLADRWLVHAEFNDELDYMQESDEIRIWKAPRYGRPAA
jgi:hypothetical protein